LVDAHITSCTGVIEEKAAPAVERQTAVHNCGTAYDVKNALDAGGFPRANALSLNVRPAADRIPSRALSPRLSASRFAPQTSRGCRRRKTSWNGSSERAVEQLIDGRSLR